jgi:hypothetical protein
MELRTFEVNSGPRLLAGSCCQKKVSINESMLQIPALVRRILVRHTGLE